MKKRVKAHPLDATTRTCTKCRVEKPLENFVLNPRAPTGRGSWCKPCKTAIGKTYRDKLANVVKPADFARFWRKVNKDGPTASPELGPCWLWTGAGINLPSRYGRFFWRGRIQTAHRVSLEIHGTTPPEWPMVVDHMCKNVACVRPDHLRVVHQTENTTTLADRSQAVERQRATLDARYGPGWLQQNIKRAKAVQMEKHRAKKAGVTPVGGAES